MRTPANIKQAMEDDSWKVRNIYNKYDVRIRVDFESRFRRNGKNFISFWINKKNFRNRYPNTWNNH
jgi:hypothetical protein